MSLKAEFLSFEDKLAFGEDGEKAVATFLVSRGIAVSPLYQFKGHDSAPFLLTKDKSIVLPDLSCWGNGESFFVECKRKNQWVEFLGYPETGFNHRHYLHYLQVKEKTGQKVYLFFLHENEGSGVYYGEITLITPFMRFWDGSNRFGKKISVPLALFPKHILKRRDMQVAKQVRRLHEMV